MFRALIFLTGLLVPAAVSAQDGGFHLTDTGWDCRGFLYCDSVANVVEILTEHIITTVLVFIGSLAIVVFLYGAARIVTSQGQEGKEAGKKAILWASLGLVGALLTGAIVDFVVDYLYFLGGA